MSLRRVTSACLLFAALMTVVFMLSAEVDAGARNIAFYKDTIGDSKPGELSNHTFDFTIFEDVSPGGYFEFTPPTGFEILSSSTFGVRSVEMYVNGSPRSATSTASATDDGVSITPGSPGSIRYTLNSSTGVSSGDEIRFLLGNHTTNSILTASTTGTTTIPADISAIKNSSVTGTKAFNMTVSGTSEPTYADFVIAIVDGVGAGADTTETIPPYRFNGTPTSTVGGTTLSAQVSLETDEFATCRYSTTAGVDFNSMTETFDETLWVTHSKVVSVAVSGLYTFYVRCIDDEGNFNTDDYLISFTRLDTPQGTANEEGSTDGDGTGSGDDGTGSGTGAGGSSGGQSGEENNTGENTGGGGSGGGGGGGSGGGSGSQGGGGFESQSRPYESGDAEVIISGYAFPNSEVVFLVDGEIADTDTANSNGVFSTTLDEIARGVYTFGVYAVDSKGVKSSTFSTTFSVIGAKTSNLSNVNIMPTVLVTPDPADLNSTVTFSGYSLPSATVTLENQKDKVSQSLKTHTTESSASGAWTIEVPTDGFSVGSYKVRAKAEQAGGVETDFSEYTFYGVGEEADVTINADLNRDGSVNLIDFSILLFWWGTDGGTSDPPADINRDGSVSLTDFSILLFNWTG